MMGDQADMLSALLDEEGQETLRNAKRRLTLAAAMRGYLPFILVVCLAMSGISYFLFNDPVTTSKLLAITVGGAIFAEMAATSQQARGAMALARLQRELLTGQ